MRVVADGEKRYPRKVEAWAVVLRSWPRYRRRDALLDPGKHEAMQIPMECFDRLVVASWNRTKR